jgi:hypothetical protein
MPTPDIDKPTPELEEQSCYDRDLLRKQITTLRKEASQRVRLEEIIEKKFHEETSRLQANTESKLQRVKERCASQIVSLNADFEKDKKRLEGQVQAQQTTLDKQKKEREAQILREWEEVEKEKTDDLEFETLSAGESLSQQKEDAERKTSSLIESLAQTIEQLDDDLKKLQDRLVRWKVATADSLSPTDSEDNSVREPDANPADAASDKPFFP